MKHEERVAKSKELVAQMDELIRTTNEKLKRMDDENNQRINLAENAQGSIRKRS